MKYSIKTVVGHAIATAIDAALSWCEGDDMSARLDGDEYIAVLERFTNGYSVSVRCCGTHYDEDESNNAAWTEMILYNPAGGECCVTDCDGKFFQVWEVEYDGNTYVMEVVRDSDVQVVKHGVWHTPGLIPYCSVCLNPSAYDCDGTHARSAYCPKCGVRMDEV